MLGILYLVLILGWILVIIFLKCKKTIAPHLSVDTSPQGLGRNPSVHVIQLRPEDFRETPVHQSIIDDDAIINPAYNHDEELIINAPPPSYEEVMRQPEIYPKVQEVKST